MATRHQRRLRTVAFRLLLLPFRVTWALVKGLWDAIEVLAECACRGMAYAAGAIIALTLWHAWTAGVHHGKKPRMFETTETRGL